MEKTSLNKLIQNDKKGEQQRERWIKEKGKNDVNDMYISAAALKEREKERKQEERKWRATAIYWPTGELTRSGRRERGENWMDRSRPPPPRRTDERRGVEGWNKRGTV